jgi:hypothetical protein
MNRMMSSARLAVVGLFLVGSLALAACSPPGTPTVAKPKPSPTPTVGMSALEILQHVQAANLRDAHVTIGATLSSKDGKATSTSTGAMVVDPFQADLTTTTQLLGQQLNSEEIVAGDTFYVKTGNSTTWRAYPLDQVAASVPIDPSNLTPDKIAQLAANARVVGGETVGGVRVYHLQTTGTKTIGELAGRNSGLGALNIPANQPVTYTADLYVQADNYQPTKLQIHADAGQTKLDLVTSFTAWNQGVTITTPPASQVTTG